MIENLRINNQGKFIYYIETYNFVCENDKTKVKDIF